MIAGALGWPVPASATGGSVLSATALNSWSAVLQWTASPEVTHIQILRNGRLIDDLGFPGGATLAYTDSLLWQSTSYSYEMVAFDAAGALVSDQSASVTTPAQAGAFPRLYDPTSFWNQPILADAAVDANSPAMVSSALVAYSGSANFTNSDEWGRPLAYANTVSGLFSVGCVIYDCQTAVSFRIPHYAKPATGADHHVIVLDPSTNSELDMFMAAYDPSVDSWSAGSRYLAASDGWGAACALGQHCLGSVAAGFDGFGGVVRPEEIAQGHIDHALVFATPYTQAGTIACPATHTDGATNDPAAIPEGARIQLDPAFDVDGQPWPAWEKTIARALQTYGAYLEDTGGSLAFYAEPNLDRGYDAWSLAGVPGAPQSLANLPWDSFRVLSLQYC